MKNWLAIIVCGLIFNSPLEAEDEEQPSPFPETEIYLYDLSCNQKLCNISHGKNISSNKGYDNQPYFTPNNQSFLFVSMRDGKQIDVYEYFLKSGETQQVTDTESMEYSPKTSPDNQTITFVRDGGNPDQTVWQMDRTSKKLSSALNSKEPVGYYHINHSTGDALFWSRYGWSVQYLNLKKDQGKFISGNAIPSTPKQIPNGSLFSFVHRQTNSEVWIKSFDPSDFSITPIAPIFGTNYDYAWAPNGDLFQVQENDLFRWSSKNRSWQKQQSLRTEFKGKISRMAISPNGKKIALVENR